MFKDEGRDCDTFNPLPIDKFQFIDLPYYHFDLPLTLVVEPRLYALLYQFNATIKFVDRGAGVAEKLSN